MNINASTITLHRIRQNLLKNFTFWIAKSPADYLMYNRAHRFFNKFDILSENENQFDFFFNKYMELSIL